MMEAKVRRLVDYEPGDEPSHAPVWAILVGESNEDIEAQFAAEYDSNDYELSYAG